jgi:Mg2+/citrate symporter
MLAIMIKVSYFLVNVAAWGASTARGLAELAVRTSTLTLVNYIHLSASVQIILRELSAWYIPASAP